MMTDNAHCSSRLEPCVLCALCTRCIIHFEWNETLYLFYYTIFNNIRPIKVSLSADGLYFAILPLSMLSVDHAVKTRIDTRHRHLTL